MRESTKQIIEPLLQVLRSYPMLEEARETEFYLKGRDFVHFHETADGVIADVLLSRGRVSMSVSTAGEQAELLERVESRLESLGEHDSHRHERRGQKGRGHKNRGQKRRHDP